MKMISHTEILLKINNNNKNNINMFYSLFRWKRKQKVPPGTTRVSCCFEEVSRCSTVRGNRSFSAVQMEAHILCRTNSASPTLEATNQCDSLHHVVTLI